MSTLMRVLLARNFAVASHDDQMYGTFPYIYHLEKCQGILRKYLTDAILEYFGLSREEVECAVFLHDVVEDTPVTPKMLQAIFGSTITNLVVAVTDVEGKNRHERKWGSPSNPGPMVLIPTVPGSVVVKMIDRQANMEACLANLTKRQRGKKASMYVKEWGDFKEALFDPECLPLRPLWSDMERTVELLRESM